MSEHHYTKLKRKYEHLLDRFIYVFRGDMKTIESLQSQVDRYTKALKYYADADHIGPGTFGGVEDGGVARRALKEK